MAQSAPHFAQLALPPRPVIDLGATGGVDRSLGLKRQIKRFDQGATSWSVELQVFLQDERASLKAIDADRDLLRFFYNATFKSNAAMRIESAAARERTAEIFADMLASIDSLPLNHRGLMRKLLREFKTVADRMDRVGDSFIESREKIANEAYVLAHRDTDVTLSREQHRRQARLVHSIGPDGWHRFNSPDVIGLNAGGPTLEEAKQDALSALKWIATSRGATVPDAVFFDGESAEA